MFADDTKILASESSSCRAHHHHQVQVQEDLDEEYRVVLVPGKMVNGFRYYRALESVSMIVKDRRPVGLPATGNERHGVQGSTPVSEGCDRYHPLLLP